ncbi:hypothetical protein COI92_15800 [Bacillus anthracis]|nr:hypothetical protein COI92_15800 [Bacillus anthracis]
MASLDIFGQQRFSIQEPHLTKIIELLQNLNQNLMFVNWLSIPSIKKSFIENEIIFYYKYKISIKKHRIKIDIIRRNVIKHMKLIVYNQFLTL